jgi:hypothetical protein
MAVKVEQVQAALASLQAGDLTEAARLLGPMVPSKRHVRAASSTAAPEEVAEVERWLKRIVADPTDAEAGDLLTRSYYKLRSQMPA